MLTHCRQQLLNNAFYTDHPQYSKNLNHYCFIQHLFTLCIWVQVPQYIYINIHGVFLAFRTFINAMYATLSFIKLKSCKNILLVYILFQTLSTSYLYCPVYSFVCLRLPQICIFISVIYMPCICAYISFLTNCCNENHDIGPGRFCIRSSMRW
jgi:hypothetical protein